MRRPHLCAAVAAVVIAALVVALAAEPPAARADSIAVGPLPPGPTVSLAARHGSLVSITLPRRSPSTGLVWRLARPIDGAVAREVSEGEVGRTVVVVYRLTGRGSTVVHYALTRGESSPVAVEARTAHITSR